MCSEGISFNKISVQQKNVKYVYSGEMLIEFEYKAKCFPFHTPTKKKRKTHQFRVQYKSIYIYNNN